MPLTLLTARAATRLRAMLDRGFTTVRDTGGCDWGIKTGVEQGHLVGPRLFIAGQSIGPTGGHSDGRRRTDVDSGCACCNGLAFKSSIADGIDEVRKAAREQMRQGADHVKIMMSGGVASPYDPLDSLQFSEGEVRGGGRGGARLRPLRLRPRLLGRSHHARGPARRAHHRARQPDRRRGRQADGREGHVPGRQPRHLLRHEGAGGEVRHDGREPGEERHRAGGRACARSRSASATACRWPTAATCWASCTGTRAASSRCGSEVVAPDRDHPLGDDHRGADPAPGGQGRHARARRLRRSPGGRRRSPARTWRCWRTRASISPSS